MIILVILVSHFLTNQENAVTQQPVVRFESGFRLIGRRWALDVQEVLGFRVDSLGGSIGGQKCTF